MGRNTNKHVAPPPKANLSDDLAQKESGPYGSLCLSCHLPPGPSSTPRQGPPFRGVLNHYRFHYGDDQEAMLKAMVEFVKAPDPDKSLMPGCMNRFGLMPALPLPEKELTETVQALIKSQGNSPGCH